MYRGYVKLWRKSLDSAIFDNPVAWKMWCWCLMKATHKECDQIVGFQTVLLKPGEFIFGRLKAAEELKITERSVRTCIALLKKLKNVTIKTTNKFSIISIVNWPPYQGSENESDQQSDQQVTNKRPTSDQQVTTNKNDKNDKKVFTIPSLVDVLSYCSERANQVDGNKWYDYYSSNGWMVGRNKMKDWKASVRTWEKNSGGNNGTGNIRSTGAPIKKAGRAESDGLPYPVDHEF